LNFKMTPPQREYFSKLRESLNEVYRIVLNAKKRGLDPSLEPETKIAGDMAALVEGLVGPKGIADRIRSLSKVLSREELAFKIAEEIIYGRFGHLEEDKAAEQAIRASLAILTEGVTAAPLQGVSKVSIKRNFDNSKYLAIYFAGPIRSAGGTDQALTLVIGDFIRKKLNLDRYKPVEEEIGRFIEEMRLYERSVSRFQYHVSDNELRNAISYLPVEVTGTETDPVEVSSFRNLPRIETNRVRGGALRVVNDGVVGRARKVITIVEKLGIEGWDWLKDIGAIETKKITSFMEDVIAGRPIFSFPSRHGGFRLRYGRARNTGLSAVGVHPLTMKILQDFLATGTQLRLEGPGKAGIVVPVDTIEPPIVKLRDGSVVRLSKENLDAVKGRIQRILFVGDLLVSYGDFLENNKDLLPAGYTEEWWIEELREVVNVKFGGDTIKAANSVDLPPEYFEKLLEDPFTSRPSAKEAVDISLKLGVPLHPHFTYLWSRITREELLTLRKWLFEAAVKEEKGVVLGIKGTLEVSIKGLLERIQLPHRVIEDRILIEGGDAHAFASCLGFFLGKIGVSHSDSTLGMIEDWSNIRLREKAPTFLGARMARPEKAKRREMRPMVHVLFPVGLKGGPQRNLMEAAKNGPVYVELAHFKCPKCNRTFFTPFCPDCGCPNIIEKKCPQCGNVTEQDFCQYCKVPVRGFQSQKVDLKGLLEEACKRVSYKPKLLKGVKGLTNEFKVPEIVEKGVLRAKYNLSVYKDGTIRFDATNAPLTHFKPIEIGVSLEKLRELGYTHNYRGEPISSLQDICELKIQDVIIPRSCAKYFVRVAKFLDELLEKVYGVSPYYNVGKEEDLLGHLVVGLAPHTLVGVLGRIIGFTEANVCLAHPLWHSAKRRDCDGDEDSLMLALDTVLNFSKSYLPSQIGGIMDAPFFIMPSVNPKEVQRQAHNMDVDFKYPIEFYDKTLSRASSRSVERIINIVRHRLNSEAQFQGFGYTIPVSDINDCNHESSYKKLRKMMDKLERQMALAEKIDAVDAKLVAVKVLNTHFLKDIAGNLRAFTTQVFRCKSCNKRYRRVPLKGRCPSCGGALTMTVYRGNIEKYLALTWKLIKKYGLPDYYAQRISLIEEEINTLFGLKSRQISLSDFISD